MFHYTHIVERSFTREQWYDLYRIIRKVGERGSIQDESELQERVDIKALIEKKSLDGQIGLVSTGMDCDCVQYCHSRIVTGMTAFKFQKLRDEEERWADGPCHLALCHPYGCPESYSRDLIMEAYENGHSHVVCP